MQFSLKLGLACAGAVLFVSPLIRAAEVTDYSVTSVPGFAEFYDIREVSGVFVNGVRYNVTFERGDATVVFPTSLNAPYPDSPFDSGPESFLQLETDPDRTILQGWANDVVNQVNAAINALVPFGDVAGAVAQIDPTNGEPDTGSINSLECRVYYSIRVHEGSPPPGFCGTGEHDFPALAALACTVSAAGYGPTPVPLGANSVWQNGYYIHTNGAFYNATPANWVRLTPAPLTPVEAEATPAHSGATSAFHPHHNGSATAINGLDDPINVTVFGSSTANGDTVDFTANQIDPATLALGPGGAAPDLGTPPLLNTDSDGDGDNDATFFGFSTGDSGMACADTSLDVTGETYGGAAFQGTATITTNCYAQCHN